MFRNRVGIREHLFLTSREETRQLCINDSDVSVYQGRDTSHHCLRQVEIINLLCQGHSQGFCLC